MKQISIGAAGTRQIGLDLLKLVDTRLLVQANSGGGKSWLLRLLAEQAGDKLQTIILDNEGEYYTLREKLDMVLVGTDGELPTNPRTAALLARRLIETQVSAVVDLYELKLHHRREFVKIFLESLIHLPRTLWRPTLVIIDEAHLYCPERGAGDAESTEAVISLMSQGRKRGYCGVLATQRLSKLHKDAAAECNNVVIGRTSLDVDQKRAGDILGMSKADAIELRNLGDGDWYGFGPAFSEKGVFHFHAGQVQTTHPKPGQRHELTAPKPSAKVKQVLAQLADLPQQAEAEIRDLVGARKRIQELEREVKAKPIAAPSDREVLHAKAEAMKEARAEWASRVKILEEKLRTAQRDFGRVGTMFGKAFAIHEQIAGELQKIDATPVALPPAQTSAQPPPPVPRYARAAPRPAPPRSTSNGDSSIPKGERAVLIAAGQYDDGVTREQLTVLTGYKRSSRDAYIQRLREKGLVEIAGDRVRITDAGVEQLGDDFEPLPTGDALRDYWIARLPEGERRILEVLLESYPDAIDRAVLDEVTGYKRSSRDAYLQRLSVKRLVANEGRGSVRASALLFD